MREMPVSPIFSNNYTRGWKLDRVLIILGVAVASFATVLLVQVQAQSTPSGTICEGCLLPPVGLIAWWPGDGNASDIQLGNNGNLINGTGFGTGLVKQAFNFDGQDDFVDVPDTPALHAIA